MKLAATTVRVTKAALNSPFLLGFGSHTVESGIFIRESRIYPLSGDHKNLNEFEDGEVVIIYTSSPFKLISRLKDSRLGDNLDHSLFYSSGYAAVIGFVASSKEVDTILKVAEPSYEFSEQWTVKKRVIVQHAPAQSTYAETKLPKLICLPETIINEVEDSETVILKDIYDAIAHLSGRVSVVGEPFVSVLESICYQTNDLALQIVFIEGKISAEKFKILLEKYAGAEDDDSVNDVVGDFDGIHDRDPVKAVENLQALRDELVQIRACLKYYYRQGFTCFPPLLQTDYPVGFDSLFGYNSCLWGLQGLFEQIQKANESIQTFDSFLQKLDDHAFILKRPKNVRTNSSRYIEWIEAVSKKSHFIHRDRAPNASAKFQKPISYFSSRLGFKATEISITASIESISYCDRPAWHLATLFHEYTHLFVAPIFAELRNNEALEIDFLLKCYADFFDPSNRTEHELTPYCIFKLSFWHTSFILRQIDSQNYSSGEQSTFARDFNEIKKAIDRTARDSEEIVVQTLEYSYFYQGFPDVYLKSIWSSWLSLPATYIHKRQYLLRSLLAISVDIKGDNDTRFTQAIKLLTKSISTLEGEGYVRLGAIQEINEYINDPDVRNTLRRYFFDLIEFADLSAQFLVDPQLRARMFQDREVLWKDGEYVYTFSNLEYCGDVIESPVRFLIDKLKETLKCSDSDGECLRQRGEQHSLWIFHVIGATLKEETKP